VMRGWAQERLHNMIKERVYLQGSHLYDLPYYERKLTGILGYLLAQGGVQLVLFLSCLALLALRLRGVLAGQAFIIGAGVLALADLFAFGWSYHPTVAMAYYTQPPRVVQAMAEKGRSYRFFSWRIYDEERRVFP